MLDYSYEQELLKTQQYDYVVGIDEVGRGAIAGHVVVCAVCIAFPDYASLLSGINDSKKLTASRRKYYYDIMRLARSNYFSGIGAESASSIDQHGINKAIQIATKTAIEFAVGISARVAVLADAGLLKPDMGNIIYWENIVKGDSKVMSIAAASVYAKCFRDEMLSAASDIYPQWEFDKHKGYGTARHLNLIEQHGLSPQHRRSFNFRGNK